MKILYVVFDTLRADHLGCYGYTKRTSPNIDRLAEEGVTFANAYASDVPTQPSYTSMFTGKRGISTGVVSHSSQENLDDNTPFLPQLLAREGIVTAAVSTLYHMKKYFSRGFMYYMNPVAGNPMLTQRVTADQINGFAIPWLKEHTGDDWFLFIHYWDPHTPYCPPRSYRGLFYHGNKSDPQNRSLDPVKENKVLYPFIQRLLDAMGGDITDLEYVISQYDAEIRYADEKFGEIISVLEESGILDETVIIVTSDHGESFGEHDVYFDHADVHEPIIHVPLIFKHSSFLKGKVKKAFVQLIDIAPTILELFRREVPLDFEGKSLLPLLTGTLDKQYTEIYANQGLWQATRMVRTEKWKLIKTIDKGFWPNRPELELYNLENDPQELVNIIDKEKRVADELELKLRRWEEERTGQRLDPLRVIASKGLPSGVWVREATAKEKEGTYEEWRQKMGW